MSLHVGQYKCSLHVLYGVLQSDATQGSVSAWLDNILPHILQKKRDAPGLEKQLQQTLHKMTSLQQEVSALKQQNSRAAESESSVRQQLAMLKEQAAHIPLQVCYILAINACRLPTYASCLARPSLLLRSPFSGANMPLLERLCALAQPTGN